MKKKKKLILGIFVIVILILAIILGILYLKNKETPTKVVNNYFSYLSNGQFAEASSLLDNTENTSNSAQKNQEQSYFNTYAHSIQAVVTSSKTEKDTATVTVKVTKIDMQSIFEEYIKETFSHLFSNASKSEEELTTDSNKFFEEKIKDPNVKKIEKEYTLNLIKIKKKWKIINDDSLSKAVLDVESLSTSPEAMSETPNA